MNNLLRLAFLLMFVNLISCGNKQDDSTYNNGPSQWSTSKFPVTIAISEEFSSQEKKAISSVGKTWDTAHGEIKFFNFTNGSKKIVNSLEDYNDQTLGIYKMHTKLPGYPDRALAVTQIYADRVSEGGKSFVAIRHADIIVNYDDFNFSSASSFGSYDLQTVLLHELGHFVGLNHHREAQSPSIMEPSIDSFDQIHQPFPKDSELIKDIYPPSESSQKAVTAGRSIASLTSESAQVIDPVEKEEPVILEKGIRIIHMLKADSTCEHYHNGKLVKSHKAHMKKKK